METARYTIEDMARLNAMLRLEFLEELKRFIEEAQGAKLTQEYMRPQDVAELLGVSTATIRNYIKAGKLTAYKPGAHYLIPASSVRAFLEAHKVE